jgi:hypothetical protein
MTGRGERYGGKGLLKTCDHDRPCIEVEYLDLGRTCSRMLLAMCSERYCMPGGQSVGRSSLICWLRLQVGVLKGRMRGPSRSATEPRLMRIVEKAEEGERQQLREEGSTSTALAQNALAHAHCFDWIFVPLFERSPQARA